MGFPGLRPGAEHFCLLKNQHPWDQENEIIDMYHMVRGYVICMIYIYPIYIYTKIWNDPLRGYVMVEEHLLTVKSLNIDFWWLLTTLGRSSCATSPLTNTIDWVQHSAEKLLINGEHRNLKVEESIYIYIYGVCIYIYIWCMYIYIYIYMGKHLKYICCTSGPTPGTNWVTIPLLFVALQTWAFSPVKHRAAWISTSESCLWLCPEKLYRGIQFL